MRQRTDAPINPWFNAVVSPLDDTHLHGRRHASNRLDRRRKSDSLLLEFISTNRAKLIDRCRVSVARRSGPKLPLPELAHGIPVFLDQITAALARESMPNSSTAGIERDLTAVAMRHGRDLLEQGFTVEQVIRDYGDVCQAVTKLAVETGAAISVDEFRTFNRCLDDAIAGAVTEYSQRKSESSIEAGISSVGRASGADEEFDQLEMTLTQTQKVLAYTEAALVAAEQDAHDATRRAMHDSLTGLPNRELFDDRLNHAISLADRHNWSLAVMFLDLDRFKSVNDNHGHATGDLVLKIVAERLLKHVREEDTVCRNGGDEFLYLLVNPKGRENVQRIANLMLRGIAEPVVAGGVRVVIQPSVGIAIFPDDGSSGEQLIKNADTAMYRAKKELCGFVLFDQRTMSEAQTFG